MIQDSLVSKLCRNRIILGDQKIYEICEQYQPVCAFTCIPFGGSHSFQWKTVFFINFMVFKDQLIAISEYLYTPCAIKYIKVTVLQKSEYNIISQRI